MMPTVQAAMLTISGSLVASTVAKVTVATALGLTAAWLARGNRAAVRHALLAAIFGAILLLPIASAVMTPLDVGVPIMAESWAAVPSLMTASDADLSATTVEAGPRMHPVTAQASKFSLSNLLLAGWALGAALFLLPMVIGLWQIRSLRQSGLPWRRGQSLVETLALDAGIHRRVEVLLHEALPGPMACGLVHPAIVLPRNAESWNREDLNRAILHELEHVRRCDSVTRCLARLAGAVYWFHPMVWIAWRRLVLEAERSCDDAVLRHSDATAYADQLVGLAKRLSSAQKSPLLAMANRADLATRVGAVLDSRQRRGRAGTFSLALACAAAVALVLGMSPLKLVAAPQAQPRLGFEVAAIKLNPDCSGDHQDEQFSPGRVSVTCITLPNLIQAAYGTFANGPNSNPKRLRLFGAPNWMGSSRYNIAAKAEDEAPMYQMFGPMLQVLLEDRFRLKVHRETRELPVYTMTVAKGGLKIQATKEGSCIPLDLSHADQPSPNWCGRMTGKANGLHITDDAYGMSMAEIASRFLANRLDRPVIDKTGLAGAFDAHVEFTRDNAATTPDNPADAAAPSIFTAVQEQLGLKLSPDKGPVEVLVIDHVEKLSEN